MTSNDVDMMTEAGDKWNDNSIGSNNQASNGFDDKVDDDTGGNDDDTVD